MNIYDFFNSPDVAEHCQSIEHTFNAVECAVMISQSDKRTLEEKLEAYRAVIAEYPDMEIPKAFNHGHIKSFHKALEGVIAFEEQLLEKFLSTEQGTAYQAEGTYRKLFSSYEKAFADALEYYEKLPDLVKIYKKYLNSDGYIYANVSSAGKILLVGSGGNDKELFASFDSDAGVLLESFYIDIPVPFKAGDLVECNRTGMGDVFVLKGIIRDDAEENAKRLLTADISDMIADIYFEENGNIECEVMYFYPDLRYCRRELEGERLMLKYVSLYEQKKLCLCSLLKLQKYFMLHEKIIKLKKSRNLTYQLERINDKLLDT